MNILIIGGGISGISAAKVALEEKHKVTIVESSPEPGGLMARIANCRVGFKTFFDEIASNPDLTVIKNAAVLSADKRDNTFFVTLSDGQNLAADRVIIAAGLLPYDPVEYKGKRVLTSLEYDAIIDQRNGELPADFNKIAFVLCVGSRSEEYPLCSSVCCSYSMREIKWTLQRAKPEIKIFYNDLRLFGQEFFLEDMYRNQGVSFIRSNSRYFEEDENGVRIRYYACGRVNEERFNYVVLSMALRPNPGLVELSGIFGFSLNEHGFVKEKDPLCTDIPGIFVSGGALEPMNIKDSILTGFGAGMLASQSDEQDKVVYSHEFIYKEEEPEIDIPEGNYSSCLFYLGTDTVMPRMYHEYISSKFVDMAREMKRSGKSVYMVTKNMIMPSYEELRYENARREGVIFIHLDEGESAQIESGTVTITGPYRELPLNAEKIIRSDDYTSLFDGREFISAYRSEPQIRWSPTKWDRKKYHAGFIRHPRSGRWEQREILGALGEILLEKDESRLLPEINEERCSGCGSCKEACPHSAIEIEIQERQMAVFGPDIISGVPVAHINEDTCVSCGLCVSTCPADVISFPEGR